MRASFALQSLFSQANSLEYNQIGQLKEVIITPDIQGMRICAKETHDVLFYHIHISGGKALLKSGQEFIFAACWVTDRPNTCFAIRLCLWEYCPKPLSQDRVSVAS